MGDPHGALEEAQRGMAVNSHYGQSYLYGTAAAWQVGAVDPAREWICRLREHPAFSSLEALRVTMLPTYDPAAMGQFEHLMHLLREAGLPAQ